MFNVTINETQIRFSLNNINHVEVVSDSNCKSVVFADINQWLADAGRQPLDEYNTEEVAKIRREYVGYTLEKIYDHFK